jgi:hypothetical protein
MCGVLPAIAIVKKKKEKKLSNIEFIRIVVLLALKALMISLPAQMATERTIITSFL